MKKLITSKVAVFTYEGKTYTCRSSESNFDGVTDALKTNDYPGAVRAFNKKEKSKIKVKGNDLYFEEEKFDPIFAEAYAVAKDYGLSIDKLELFFKNLADNPSPISVHAFSSFIAKSRMPITDRGTFLAYKKVNNKFKDIYTDKFDNRPGSVCSMDRFMVDIDQSKTCSTGFHACSYDYLPNFGANHSDNIVVVEINPVDVVAVPPDYQMTKMRVASYRVLCTLNYFKKKLLSYEADALGNIPIFNTSYFKDNWKPLSDVNNKEKSETYMTPSQWLNSRSKVTL